MAPRERPLQPLPALAARKFDEVDVGVLCEERGGLVGALKDVALVLRVLLA